MKRLAVIILNWNGIELLKKFLPTAADFTISDEADLIVADNGSTDGSAEWVEQNCPGAKVIRFDKNHGFSEGYNKAIDATGYPFTILLNSDVEVTPGWWRPLLQFLEENTDVGACQPKILSYRDKSRFEYAGAAGGYLDRLGYPYCRGRMFEYIETDNGQYDGSPADICWASGAALAVRTDLYRSIGGLDPLFFAHMEEIDLCCRIHASGFRVCAVPQSKVYHVGGASLSMGDPRKTYLNFRNNLLLLHKNLPRNKGKRVIFMRRLADTLAWGMFIMKRDFKNAKAIVKAHADFRKMRKNYTDFPREDRLHDLPGGNRLVVIDHFLLRKNK